MSTQERKRLKVLVFQGGTGNKDFAIDEEDFLVIWKTLCHGDDCTLREKLKIVEIRENDEDRRVYKLRISKETEETLVSLLLPLGDYTISKNLILVTQRNC
jgi:hypothetical protein